MSEIINIDSDEYTCNTSLVIPQDPTNRSTAIMALGFRCAEPGTFSGIAWSGLFVIWALARLDTFTVLLIGALVAGSVVMSR